MYDSHSQWKRINVWNIIANVLIKSASLSSNDSEKRKIKYSLLEKLYK